MLPLPPVVPGVVVVPVLGAGVLPVSPVVPGLVLVPLVPPVDVRSGAGVPVVPGLPVVLSAPVDVVSVPTPPDGDEPLPDVGEADDEPPADEPLPEPAA